MACYSAFVRSPDGLSRRSLDIQVTRCDSGPGWDLAVSGEVWLCADSSDLVYFLEKALTTGLQHRRKDLLFLHAAAVGKNGRCLLIAGESGIGKSTLCWALCNAGLEYLSDELAPVDVGELSVTAYPHALCIKKLPPGAPPLPEMSFETGVTTHIPVEAMPNLVATERSRLAAVVFLVRDADSGHVSLADIPAPEASARLYSNTLNPLAHDNEGLGAVARLARRSKCMTLSRGSLRDMQRCLIPLLEA